MFKSLGRFINAVEGLASIHNSRMMDLCDIVANLEKSVHMLRETLEKNQPEPYQPMSSSQVQERVQQQRSSGYIPWHQRRKDLEKRSILNKVGPGEV